MDHLEAIYTEKHWLYVATQHNLALMYEAAGKHKLALDNMRHVLKLRLQVSAAYRLCTCLKPLRCRIIRSSVKY